MPMSMFHASIPLFTRQLTALKGIMQKGATHAEVRKIDPSVLVGARLYPDMHPFSRQIQIATDTAKGAAARLAGVEIPSYEDNEKTFDELTERLEKTLQFIGGFSPAQIDGSEEKVIVLKMRNNEMRFSGQDYLAHFVIPNFYFHVTTAYNILRHCGVELGKRDFIGAR